LLTHQSNDGDKKYKKNDGYKLFLFHQINDGDKLFLFLQINDGDKW